MSSEKGFIASREGVPVFVYNQNQVVELTDESTQLAYAMNGEEVEADVSTYFPDGRVKAKLVVTNIVDEQDRKNRRIAWEMYRTIKYSNVQYKNFEDTWNEIKKTL